MTMTVHVRCEAADENVAHIPHHRHKEGGTSEMTIQRRSYTINLGARTRIHVCISASTRVVNLFPRRGRREQRKDNEEQRAGGERRAKDGHTTLAHTRLERYGAYVKGNNS